jgi:hypothetical protein
MKDSDTTTENTMKETENSHKKISSGVFKKFGVLLATRWPEYLVEIIVVIIGITISFAISNMQIAENNRSTEQLYLAELLADITSDIQELDSVIAETQKVIQSAGSLLDESHLGDPSMANLTFVNHVTQIMGRPNFVSKNKTINALKSGGYFHLIKDNELKQTLFEYDQQYQGLKAVELAELQVMSAITGPYIIKLIPLNGRSKIKNRIENLEVQKIMKQVEFVNNIELRLSNRQELLEGYIALKGLAHKIKDTATKNIQ